MSIKYKIDDAKKNKNLINDEIKLSRIKSKGGPGNDRTPPKKQKLTLTILYILLLIFTMLRTKYLDIYFHEL